MVSTMSSVEVATEGRDETQGKLNSKHDKMGTLIVGANISCTHPKNIRKLRDTKSLGNILNRSEYSSWSKYRRDLHWNYKIIWVGI